MKRIAVLLAGAALAFAGDQAGLRPRTDAADYPSHTAGDTLAIGASLLSQDQVKNTFATDLARGYVVVELSVYPKNGASLDLGPGDFVLRIAGTDTSARPASPRAIAAILRKASSKDRNVDLYPSVGIGYETGPRGYDPATGGTRGGGWNTSAGVGVGTGGAGGPHPASTDADRRTMELELGDKQLPETVTTAPVAGYLYFPLLTRKKTTDYELEYEGRRVKLELPLEAPRTR